MAISWLINGGDPNLLPSGMILQVWEDCQRKSDPSRLGPCLVARPCGRPSGRLTYPPGWMVGWLSLSLPLPLVRLVFGGVVATLTGGYHFQHSCRDVHVPEMPMESDAKILGPWNLKILYPRSVQESKRTGSAGK